MRLFIFGDMMMERVRWAAHHHTHASHTHNIYIHQININIYALHQAEDEAVQKVVGGELVLNVREVQHARGGVAAVFYVCVRERVMGLEVGGCRGFVFWLCFYVWCVCFGL